jgi:hypothetical protein
MARPWSASATVTGPTQVHPFAAKTRYPPPGWAGNQIPARGWAMSTPNPTVRILAAPPCLRRQCLVHREACSRSPEAAGLGGHHPSRPLEKQGKTSCGEQSHPEGDGQAAPANTHASSWARAITVPGPGPIPVPGPWPVAVPVSVPGPSSIAHADRLPFRLASSPTTVLGGVAPVSQQPGTGAADARALSQPPARGGLAEEAGSQPACRKP